MTKLEMAKKLFDLTDENGRVKLEDLARLVFDKDSPQDAVENFKKKGAKLAEAENLWHEVGKIGNQLQMKTNELESLQIEFDSKYQSLKQISEELGMDKYLHLP